jgi:hypothetical protein
MIPRPSSCLRAALVEGVQLLEEGELQVARRVESCVQGPPRSLDGGGDQRCAAGDESFRDGACVVHFERNSELWAAAVPDLDVVDHLGLLAVGELQRRLAGVQDDNTCIAVAFERCLLR